MSTISFTLDGKNISVKAGTTILEAARQNDINIPTLCHDPRLKPTAACRLCLVEVEKAKGPVAACDTAAAPGMVVTTSSEALVEGRRMALELLLSDHYGDCISPCQNACPAGIDIQGQIAHIANGDYLEAVKLIKESNPLPLVCGRVCPRFCEKKCRRTLVDGPVAINMLKRFVADWDLNNGGPYIPRAKPATGYRVAVVGGGPAGLSTAFFLALEGHSVSIFESGPRLGGMLRYGIPEYRLPKAVLDREIASITRLCSEVKCHVSLGRDFTLESLKAAGFQAVFLALGAQKDQKMGIPGEELPGVYSGIGFLRDAAQGKECDPGTDVVVVGGGNTAIDAARTALRLGAERVTIVYRRSREEMPANDEEVEGAEQEGVQFQFLAGPEQILARDGKVKSVRCIRMALGAPDASGRRRPEPVPGSELDIEASSVIMAVGQSVDVGGLGPGSPVKIGRHGEISIDESSMETKMAGVFAGGDCTSGPATVVEAVGAGRRAAASIHRYLIEGKTGVPVKPYNCSKGEPEDIDPEEYAAVECLPRAVMPALEAGERRRSFAEIETGIDAETARKEAGRCLSCGCQEAFECRLRELATEYRADDSSYAGRRRRLPVRENEHRYILMDRNKCILCGRCVRICSEVEGVSALGFVNRGISTTVEPALGLPLAETGCISCGQCVSACPTGAVTPRINLPKPGPFRLESVSGICPQCGIGCRVELKTCNNRIIKVASPPESEVNNGNLCRRGAFEMDSYRNVKRLPGPCLKSGGRLTGTDWETAVSTAAAGLGRIKEHFGPGSIAVLASPLLTNEELYLVQKLARAALGTNNLGSFSPGLLSNGLSPAPGRNFSTCSFDDILNSDFILAYDCDLPRDYPILGLKVRQAVRQGSCLAVLNSRQTGLDPISLHNLKVNRRTGTGLLKAMLHHILHYDMVDYQFVKSRTSGFRDFAAEMKKMDPDAITRVPWVKPSRIIDVVHSYVRARHPVILVNRDTITPAELDLLNDLALATGNIGREGAGILLLRTPGNVQGLLDMGVSPDWLPGREDLSDARARRKYSAAWGVEIPAAGGKSSLQLLTGIERGEIQGLLVFGREALGEIGGGIFEVPLFSVAVDTGFPDNPPSADVVLPGAVFVESEGTFTNCEGRVQHFNRALRPPAGKENWEIISALSTALGYPIRYDSPAGIYKEITDLVPGIRLSPDKAIESRQPLLAFSRAGELEGE